MRRPSFIFIAALPLLFIHGRYQPGFTLHAGGTHVDVRLSDFAVIAIVVVALVVGARTRFAPLRGGLPVWVTAAAFLVFTFVATFYPLSFAHGYPWKTHLVTAVKYSEYALLAPAVALLIRRRDDLRLLLAVLVGVSAAATLVGLLQFFGVPLLHEWPAGGRQPSFVGVDDFGALSAAAYAIALGGVAVGPRNLFERRLTWVAALAGGLGGICSGALAGVIGVLLAAAAAAIIGRRWRLLDVRRAVVLALMAAAVLGGGIVMRGSALTHFAHFLGVGHENQPGNVESYSQRWVLDYIGFRMFEGHPLLGAGWQSGYDEEAYGPYLGAAKKKFPSQPPLAFPSPAHPWGIQNAYVEALAELGIVGFALFAVMILTGLGFSARTLLRGPPAPDTPALTGILWLFVAGGVWNSLWLIAGNPFDAIIWLAFGLAAVSRETK